MRQDDLHQSLDGIIDRALADQRIVGGIVMVMRDGEPAYVRAAGLADREAGRPMALDTIFRLASLTKPMVTAAALALVEAGIITLEDEVTRWLPDFRPGLGDATPPITIRQLLTHTAGLSYGFMQSTDGPYRTQGVSDGLDDPGLGFEAWLPRVAQAGLFYAPGTAWLYSVGMDVLGAAMEKAAGRSLPEIVARHVAEPLGLKDTGFTVTDPARLAVAYADGTPPVVMSDPYTVPFAGLAGIRFSPSRAFTPGSFPSGGAGMVGTAGEFMSFLEAIRTGGGGIVSEQTTRQMMANQIGDIPVAISGPGWGFGFGGAVLLDPAAANSAQPAGVWRWGGVYGHSWFVDPARRISALVMTNTAIEGMSGAFAVDIATAVAEVA